MCIEIIYASHNRYLTREFLDVALEVASEYGIPASESKEVFANTNLLDLGICVNGREVATLFVRSSLLHTSSVTIRMYSSSINGCDAYFEHSDFDDALAYAKEALSSALEHIVERALS